MHACTDSAKKEADQMHSVFAGRSGCALFIKYHLPDGVLGLQAEQEGGGDTVDIVHAHPVTLRSLFLGDQVTCRRWSIQEREL